MELFSSAGVVSSKSKLYDIMKLFYIAALMISSITFFSCGVVEGDLTEQENSTDLLFEDVFPTSAIDANTILRGNVVKSWETTAFKIESVNGYQECRLDDKISLDGDGTYSYAGEPFHVVDRKQCHFNWMTPQFAKVDAKTGFFPGFRDAGIANAA